MRPAPNVAVSLDHYRSVVTDANGHYDFGNVPEGNHEVALDMEQLPTDYEPGASTREPVMVNPKATARADFNVVRLAMFSGRIVAPPGVQIENVLIRLAGTNRYTTPYQDGSFSFYDLHEGDYQVEIDSRTLPEGYMLTSPASVHVSARSFTAPPPVEFEIKPKPEEVKPVRQTVQQEIHVGGQGVTAEPANSRSGGRAGGEKGSTEGGGRGSSTKGSRSGVGRGTRGAGNGAGHSGAAASGRS